MSKGRAFFEGVLGVGKAVLGHGPRCPATCECRALEAFGRQAVSVLEGAARQPRAPRGGARLVANVRPSKPVEVVVEGVALEGDVIDADVIEVSATARRLPPR